ncbi:malonate--CoA ligase [Zavarzinia sp. CC-PAN008]|uniref:malonate--CoA ligase n=1 Tax=Zavarzinia sp. CC-PAN008 TaxID=3243332 RepID=UPI003F748C8C
MTEHLYEILESRFPKDRTQPFILAHGGRPDLSYGALEAGVERVAAALARAGVRAGDRVAVQAEKSVEFVLLYLATIKAGGVFLPLNPAYTKAEVAYFLGDAEPRVFVCRPGTEGELEAVAAGARILTLGQDGQGTLMQAASVEGPGFETVPRGADDLAGLLYTSGTTGRSKGAMMSHRNLSSNALTLHKIWGFRPGDVLLHALPVFHTHGLFVALNTTLLNGSAMFYLPKFDAAEALGLLPHSTVMMGVPTFYTRLLGQAGLDRAAVANMRLFISGSAPLLAETHRQFEERTGHAILERYGMTETNMLTSNPLEGRRIAGTVGFPLPDVSLRIADDDGRVLGTDEIGGIEVQGPNVFKGYWRMPEKTASEFRDGWFITGDMGKVDAEGYVHIVGREKDLIISGGLNVYPKEVETLIDGLPGVTESAVIGVPHPDFGEAVVAVVLPAPGAALDEQAIIARARQDLAAFKVPKRVFFVEGDLPRNAMGKVQKALLRATHKDTFPAA